MKIRKLFYLIAFSVISNLQVTESSAQEKKASRPNIIFILTDDLGYGNITSFNPDSPVPTPNIDKMAAEGTRFTRFYSGSPVCAPSRGSLLTGKHMGHAYIRGNGNVSLREQDTTLAQRLQNNGYATGMFGKWGLGLENEPGAPQLKGFDTFFGYLLQKHAHHYFTDFLYEVKNRELKKVNIDSTQYSQSLIMDHALSFIEENKDRPFFLYLSTTLPHAELKVPDSLMARFRNADGSSKFPPETPYYRKGSTYSTQLQPHAAFAAMLYRLDQDVARVLKQVKDLGLDDNTYIVFTSDNGAHEEGGADPKFFNSSGPLRGLKRDVYEGGIRVPLIFRAPGRVPAGKVSNEVWAFWDIMPTLGEITSTPVPAAIDGISFEKTIAGKAQKQKHDYLYWQFNEGQFKEALIQGNWKLIRFKSQGKPETLELYDLNNDIGEKNNIALTKPAKVKELKALMQSAKSPSENPLFNWSDIEK